MEFKKYPKISETVGTAVRGGGSTLWFASEKIHGSNLSFYCDGIEVKAAKRTDFHRPVHLF
jgi:hypothetical protein